jgi:hypothetical protein
MSFDLTLFAKTAERIRERALEEERLIDNPLDEVLRSIVEKEPELKKRSMETSSHIVNPHRGQQILRRTP